MEINNRDISDAQISQKSVEKFVSFIDYANEPLSEATKLQIEEAEKLLRSESDRKAVSRELEANLPLEIKEGTVGEYLFSCIESSDPCNPVCIEGFKPSNKSECLNPVYKKSEGKMVKINSASGSNAMLYVDDESEISKSDAEKLYEDGVREIEVVNKESNKTVSRASLTYNESASSEAESDSPRNSKSPTVSDSRSPGIDIRYIYRTPEKQKHKKSVQHSKKKKQESTNWLVAAIIALVFVIFIIGLIWFFAAKWYSNPEPVYHYNKSPMTEEYVTHTDIPAGGSTSSVQLSDYF